MCGIEIYILSQSHSFILFATGVVEINIQRSIRNYFQNRRKYLLFEVHGTDISIHTELSCQSAAILSRIEKMM